MITIVIIRKNNGNNNYICHLFKSNYRNAENGVYYLKLGNQVVETFCEMGTICGSSGWGMIMKLDGKKVRVC